MSKAVQQFNGLNGTVATREQLEEIISIAKQENAIDVIYRCSKVLNEDEDAKFLVTIQPIAPTGLNAPRHVGSYKEALDECGRLRTGYKFENGSVVKVARIVKKSATKKVTSIKEVDKKIVEKVIDKPNNNTITIRKNSKEFQEVTNWKVFTMYNLSNNFEGEEITKGLSDFDKKHAKITKRNNVYTLDIHSNLWYTATQLSSNELKEKTPKKSETKPKIIGYILKDSISGENVATKKTLQELKEVFLKLDETETGKGTEIFVYEIIKKGTKNTQGKRVLVDWEKPVSNDQKKTKKTVEKPITKTKKAVNLAVSAIPKVQKKNTDVLNVSIADINIDKERFQNRNKLNEEVLQQIISKYDPVILDPVILWIDPKNKKTYLLAGHHRLEATKRVGKKTIPAKYKVATEAEAIHYAKVESNANRSLETPVEIAKIYRDLRLNGTPKSKINKLAKQQEPRANFVIALSYLEPNGIVIQTLNALEKTDTQNLKTIETFAEWIGTAKSSNDLTSLHEKEMFDFLQDKEASKRITTKADFMQKITAITGSFDFEKNTPLNLKRYKYATEGEKLYDAEYKELQKQLETSIENKANLKDRISNHFNPNFILPTSKDYKEVLQALDTSISKYTNEIEAIQKKLIELSRNKGKYTNAGSNQMGLFGAKKNAKIQKIALAGNHQKSQFFNVAGEVGKFLQQVERKPVESVVITLDGQQGAGKTTTLYKFMDSFAVTGNKCLFLSLEEHPSSSLAKDKVSKYLSTEAQENIDTVGEVESITELYDFVKDYEIIFIDSWQKLQRMVGAIRLDEDLRKKFNGKVFVVIFQQTTTGRTKGGAEVVFDGDIIIKMVKESSFANNYAYFDKNRYTLIAIEDIRYNIASGTTYNPNAKEEPATELQQKEEVEFSFIVK